jgi:protein-disulfide isomerase
MAAARTLTSRAVLAGSVAAVLGGAAVGRWLSSAAPAEATASLPSGQPPAAAAPASTTTASRADDKRYQVPVTKSQPHQGPDNAIVTIVHWCDLQGVACKNVDPLLGEIRRRYGDDVRLVFRHFSQPTPESGLAHEFARIAHESGKFWEARALLLQAERATTRADLEGYAEQLGIDWNTARAALERHAYRGHVTADRLFAQMFEVDRVPAFFVNGRKIGGEVSLPALARLVDEEIAHARVLIDRGVAKEAVYTELTKNGAWRKVSRAN